MNMLRCMLMLLVVVSPVGLCQESPDDVVKDFYRWAIRPSPAEIGRGYVPVQALLGKELYAALVAQKQYERACAALVPPDIKPYMLDQSPFFLWPDKAKALRSTDTVIAGDKAMVRATLVYDDMVWTDTVTLRLRDDRWVIQNIEWEEGRSLLERLVSFASHRCTK